MMFETERTIIGMSLKQSFAWRTNMMLSIVTGPLFVIVNYVIWKGLYAAAGTATIRGFTFEQMVVYVAISSMTIYLIWDDMEGRLRDDVHTGSLSTYLLRPIPYLWFNFVNKVGHRLMAFFIEFLPVLGILAIMFGKVILQGNWLLFGIAICIGFIIHFLLRALVGILAFYFIRPRGLIETYKVLSALLYGNILALSLFPQALQRVFIFLPFQFVSYVPTRLYMGSYELAGITLSPAQILICGVLQCIILYLIVLFAWSRAVKRFCGVGT